MINIKKCNRCLQELSISDFNFDKKKKDGYDNFCKSCKKEKIIIRYKNKEIITAKICNLCSLEKDVSKFTKAYNSKDGYFSQCKDCMKLRRREIIEENSKKNLVNINGTKVCGICKINKPYNQFYRQKDKLDGFANRCIKCERERCKKGTRYYQAKRNREYFKLCGITVKDYNREYQKQNGLCLICNQNKKLVIDHCHKSGKFRGLLCEPCNRGIGCLEENFSYVINAAHYINDHIEEPSVV